MPRIRKMAINNAGGKHPWKDMNDEEILKSAGLFVEDLSTGKKGYNLAAIMLIGKDETILSACPAYRTDALLRKINVDRYDDRLIVQTNLIESYDRLMEFAEKHLWDKFFLEGDSRASLRNIIAREMLVNTLIHREMTSSYIAKFVIEKDKMYVENANRALKNGIITPDNLEPNPKNPIIASFFRNIGHSDQLGSGVRNLYKYVKYYSGKEPELIEGDVFKIIVPLDDTYSFDAEMGKGKPKDILKGKNCTLNCTLTEKAILDFIIDNPNVTQKDIAEAIGKSLRTIKNSMDALQDSGLLKREGSKKFGNWVVCNKNNG